MRVFQEKYDQRTELNYEISLGSGDEVIVVFENFGLSLQFWSVSGISEVTEF